MISINSPPKLGISEDFLVFFLNFEFGFFFGYANMKLEIRIRC
jgi:hypothetical protein